MHTMRNQTKNDKGLAGVAALIVFIALVLVAAIAATVILDVTGELEQQASNTGEEAEGELSSTLQVIEATGVVDGSESNITQTNYTLSVAPGADPVNLTDVTIELTTDEKSVQLAASSNNNANGNNTGEFTINRVVSETDNNVIESSQDRYKISIDHTQSPATGVTLNDLKEGENVELVFESGQGGTRFYEFTVPSSLSELEETVTL